MLKGLNLKKGEVPNAKILEFTGSRLSQSLKNPQAKEISERLRNHPEDSKSRLELVAMLLEEENNRSFENIRDAYLLTSQTFVITDTSEYIKLTINIFD